jgi:hypothetical protein
VPLRDLKPSRQRCNRDHRTPPRDPFPLRAINAPPSSARTIWLAVAA